MYQIIIQSYTSGLYVLEYKKLLNLRKNILDKCLIENSKRNEFRNEFNQCIYSIIISILVLHKILRKESVDKLIFIMEIVFV